MRRSSGLEAHEAGHILRLDLDRCLLPQGDEWNLLKFLFQLSRSLQKYQEEELSPVPPPHGEKRPEPEPPDDDEMELLPVPSSAGYRATAPDMRAVARLPKRPPSCC